MENTIQIQTEQTLDADSLLAVSLILIDASRRIVAILLRYMTIGLSITDKLVNWAAPSMAGQL